MANVRRMLNGYVNHHLVEKDVVQLTKNCRELLPKREDFVFPDGIVRNLFMLGGTIPISYRGARYNIPIAIYILYQHPYVAPMCYVKPTKDMLSKSGRHVDTNGKIYLPYLHEWKYPGSDLSALSQMMIMQFGEECPVYMKPANPRPPNPYTVRSAGGYAPRQSYSTNPYLPIEVQQPPTIGFIAGLQQPPNQQAPWTPAVNYNSRMTLHQRENDIDASMVRMSLECAVEDHLIQRFYQAVSQADIDMVHFKATQEDLTNGSVKLDNIMASLEKDQQDMYRNIKLLQDKINELSHSVEDATAMKHKEQDDIDDVVVPTSPLYKQLLELFAEENAIEDTLYYLGEGLKKSIIELDVYLKVVRELSRKQFKLRALIFKARQKAGLRC